MSDVTGGSGIFYGHVRYQKYWYNTCPFINRQAGRADNIGDGGCGGREEWDAHSYRELLDCGEVLVQEAARPLVLLHLLSCEQLPAKQTVAVNRQL